MPDSRDPGTAGREAEALRLLDGLGWQIEPPPPPPPENTCTRCGMTETAADEEFGWGLWDITVEVRPGQEGTAQETRWFCPDHLDETVDTLRAAGFGNHRHGGTNTLADPRCPGSGDTVGGVCPALQPYRDNDEDEEGDETDHAADHAAWLLRRLGYQVEPPPLTVPEWSCVTCGMTATAAGSSHETGLWDITVTVRPGEEGHAQETRWFCAQHTEQVLDTLVAAGFGNHRHDSADSLTDPTCPSVST